MNKNNNKNKVSKVVKKVAKVKNKIRRNARRVRRMARRIKNISRRNRGLKLAQRANFRGFMKIVKSDYNSLVVSGVDMVYKMPTEEQIMETDVLALIPANPAYWTGTRISALASVYQQYRPLKFTVQYIPSTGATRDGNIIGGSLWNMVPPANGIEQALMGVPGSMTTQVFMKATAKVPLKSNLSQNLYNIGGEYNDKSNPFIYVALSKGNVVDGKKYRPGFFVVHYTYLLKNPLTVSSIFVNQGLIKYKDLNYYTNTSIYMCSDKDDQNILDTQIDKFQLIQVNRSEGEDANELNGQFVSIDPESYVWVLSNYSKDDKQNIQPTLIEKTLVFTDVDILAPNASDYYTDAYGIYAYPSGGNNEEQSPIIKLVFCGGDSEDVLHDITYFRDENDGVKKRWIASVKPDEIDQFAALRAISVSTRREYPYYDDPLVNQNVLAGSFYFPAIKSSGWQIIKVGLNINNNKRSKIDKTPNVNRSKVFGLLNAPIKNRKEEKKEDKKEEKKKRRSVSPFNAQVNKEEENTDWIIKENEIIPVDEMIENKGKCVKGKIKKSD